MKNIKKQKGFTLIEMVIVVALLGILSSIAIVQYGEVQKRAKENADFTNASNIATAAYLAINDEKLKTKVTIDDLKTNGYLTSIPKPQSVDGDFTINIVGDQEVTVLAGKTVFYPKQSNNSDAKDSENQAN